MPRYASKFRPIFPTISRVSLLLSRQPDAVFKSLIGNVSDTTLFSKLSDQDIIKVAMQSQMRQDVVPYALYVSLVPNNAEIGTLGNPESTYAIGGSLGYKLLDLLSVNSKYRYTSNDFPSSDNLITNMF